MLNKLDTSPTYKRFHVCFHNLIFNYIGNEELEYMGINNSIKAA